MRTLVDAPGAPSAPENDVAREELERAVAERTAELTAVNEQLRREVAERERADALAHRTLRALRTLTECNEALLRTSDEVELLGRVCRSVVDAGGYRMCWAGFVEHDEAKSVRPVAQCGFDEGYLEGARIVWSEQDERGRGPIGTCIRTGRPVVVRNILDDPSFAPWREEAIRRRFGSMTALPLVVDGVVRGAFVIYSSDVDAFADEAEVRLLADLAGDLSYGLTVLRAREERARMSARLVEADRLAAVGTLAGGVAHEINNPLAFMVAGIEFLDERLAAIPAATLDATELRSVLADLREGTARIRRVVADLTTLSGADDAEPAPVDVLALLDAAVQLTGTETRKRAGVVRQYGRVPPVLANAARLGQVFVNLLINAAHAIEKGDAASNEIRVTSETDVAGNAVIEVADTGCGMSPEVRARIFEPFFTTKGIGVGAGLGLSISRTIVASLGGVISVSSEPGKGTRVRVTLPPARPGGA